MNLTKIPKQGTTITRKAFWDKVSDIVIGSQKLPGKNVSVDVREGFGSIISTNPERDNSQGGGGLGACCYDDGTCDDLTEFECADAGGTWQGLGTHCLDEGVCVGACCEPDCVDNTTPDGCSADGGTFQGFGTTCDTDPCTLPPCNGCGFDAFDGSGRKFLTSTRAMTSFSASFAGPPVCPDSLQTASGTSSKVSTIDTTDCSVSCTCTGSVAIHSVNNCPSDYCDDTITANSCSAFNNCGPSGTDVLSDASDCGWSNSSCSLAVGHGCASYGITETVISATQKEIDFDYGPDGSGQFVHAVVIITLSDECNPDGMSPPP